MSSGMAYCHSTHHLSVVKLVYLSRMARDVRTKQSIWWEWHRLHLTISANVE